MKKEMITKADVMATADQMILQKLIEVCKGPLFKLSPKSNLNYRRIDLIEAITVVRFLQRVENKFGDADYCEIIDTLHRLDNRLIEEAYSDREVYYDID